MSMLTLAVDNHFRPDLSAQADVGGVVTSPTASPTCQNSPLFSAYTFSKSTSDLTLQRLGLCEFRTAPLTDPVASAPRLCPAAPGINRGVSVSTSAAVPLSAPVTGLKHTPPSNVSDNSRAGSEAPPMRKLKSSLKLPNLTKLYSTSNLLPKLVRFAPALEKVKMFDGRDSPAAVSLQNTPVGLPEFPDFDLGDYFSSHRNFTDLGFGESNSDSDSDSDTFSNYTTKREYKINLSNFSAPQNIYDKQECPVYLQLMKLASDKKLLLLFVMCQNLAFEKKVSVKLTLNNWQSMLIYNNPVHVKSFSSVNFDQFRFNVPLSHLPSTINVQFCIKYDVNGCTHWDNNALRNYNVVLSSYTKPEPTIKKDFYKSDSFAYKAPAFLPKPASLVKPTFLPKPDYKPAAYNHEELISKLVHALKNMDKAPKPRYLQSFRTKNDKPVFTLDKPVTKTTEKPLVNKPLEKTVDAKPLDLVIPETKTTIKILKKPASFQDSKFNSTSYATLLQTYCFNGSAGALPSGSLTNSRTNSSSSINSDFLAAGLHLYGDLMIHI